MHFRSRSYRQSRLPPTNETDHVGRGRRGAPNGTAGTAIDKDTHAVTRTAVIPVGLRPDEILCNEIVIRFDVGNTIAGEIGDIEGHDRTAFRSSTSSSSKSWPPPLISMIGMLTKSGWLVPSMITFRVIAGRTMPGASGIEVAAVAEHARNPEIDGYSGVRRVEVGVLDDLE